MTKLLIATLLSALPAVGCTQNKGEATSKRPSTERQSADEGAKQESSEDASAKEKQKHEDEAEVTSGKPHEVETHAQATETRPLGEILCQDGPALAKGDSEEDFSKIFATICEGGKTNATFDELAAAAYQGAGAPEIRMLEVSTSKLYVTTLLFAYAVKVKVATPAKIADLNLFAAYESGLGDASSSMGLKVGARRSFPGGGSIEEMRVTYELKLADGAALYDRREAVVNHYVPSELRRDLTLSTERLVDAEDNKHYHVARQIVVGVRNQDDTSTLVYVTDMVVKNRIDPARLQRALTGLSRALVQRTYEVAAASGN